MTEKCGNCGHKEKYHQEFYKPSPSGCNKCYCDKFKPNHSPLARGSNPQTSSRPEDMPEENGNRASGTSNLK